jgi:hypothetical protein
MARALFVSMRCEGCEGCAGRHDRQIIPSLAAPQFAYLIETPLQFLYYSKAPFSLHILKFYKLSSSTGLWFGHVLILREDRGEFRQLKASSSGERVKQLKGRTPRLPAISCTCDVCVTYKAEPQAGDAHHR